MTQQPQPFAGHFLRLQSSFTHNLIWLCRSVILYFLFASKRNKKTELLKFDRSPHFFRKSINAPRTKGASQAAAFSPDSVIKQAQEPRDPMS